MRKINLPVCLAIVLLGTTLMSAQASRTWVSGVGDDANPCSRTAPCKTFAGAISKTAPGGEIDALDPGGFGALTITKSITLDGGGGQVASVLVAGTNGIVVAAQPGDVVIIRNLRINGLLNSGNPGTEGIKWIAGKDLNIENVYVFGFSQNCIDIALNQGTAAFAHIINTVTKNCGQDGIHVTNAVAPAVQVGVSNSFTLLSSQVTAAGTAGVEAASHSRVSVFHTVSQNATNCYLADDGASDAQMNIEASEGSFCTDGVNSAAGSSIAVGNSTFDFNSSCSLHNSGGSVSSFTNGTNNFTNHDVGSTCGTISTAAAQ